MTATPSRLFVIVATQRSGSTLLVKSLDSAPGVFCAGEMFHGGPNTHHPECNYPQAILGSRRLGRIADRCFQAARVRNHVRNFYSGYGAGTRAIGFKVMTSQLRGYRTLLPSLTAMNATRLFLYREDSFAAALSNFRAKHSGYYHSDREAAGRSADVVTANLDEFQEYLERSQAHRQEALDLHARFGGLLLTYESLIEEWEKVIAAIGSALGIPELRVSKVLDRLEGSSGTARIANLDELRRKFGSATNP